MQKISVSRDYMNDILDSMTESLLVLTPDGMIETTNRATLEMLGYSEEELLLQPIGHIIADEKFLLNEISLAEEIEKGKLVNIDKRYITKDGRQVPVRFSATLMHNAAGTITGIVCVAEDVTERKQAEQQLRRYQQQLEKETAEEQVLIDKLKLTHQQLIQSEKMSAVGQLAAGVAHEINNPVGYVKSNISTLSKYVRDLFDLLSAYESVDDILGNDERFKKIAEARKAIDPEFLKEDTADLLSETIEGLSRIKKIVRDLKDFSRSDDEEWQYADLHQCLDTTLNVAWNELKYKAEVVKEYGELSEVQCLPHQLNQVFMNLLLNAAQAIETQGVIRITTEQSGDRVVVRLSDTGSGISREHIDRIFEPFYTTKQAGKGTGLGLSISYSIIQKHKGEIRVDSEPGLGTTFTVELPLKQPDVAVQ